VAPLFASMNATLTNVTALRVVAPDCLTVTNATLGAAGPLAVVLFHATKVSACTSTRPSSTAATSLTSTTSPVILTTLLGRNTTALASTTTEVTSFNSTLAQATSTVEVATPSDEQGAWIVPVAVSAAAAALLASAGVAAFLWKRKRAGQSGDEMVTARAEETSVRAMSDYGVLPGTRPTEESQMSSENSHYVELTPIEAGTIISADPP
jgi:hypothetical protein